MSNKPIKMFKPYWDSCVFISSIQRTPGRIEVIDQIKGLTKADRLLVVTSSIVMAEVIKWDDNQGGDLEEEMRRIRDYLENPWITRRVADNLVNQAAGVLRRRFHLKLADAIHLAIAQHYEVEQFQTYDQGLLKLDGQVAFVRKAGALRICHPELPEER